MKRFSKSMKQCTMLFKCHTNAKFYGHTCHSSREKWSTNGPPRIFFKTLNPNNSKSISPIIFSHLRYLEAHKMLLKYRKRSPLVQGLASYSGLYVLLLSPFSPNSKRIFLSNLAQNLTTLISRRPRSFVEIAVSVFEKSALFVFPAGAAGKSE